MKKTILTILICGFMILSITGCGNNHKQEINNETSKDTDNEKKSEQELINNNLTCQGKISLMTDFAISHGPVTKYEDKSEDMNYWKIIFPGSNYKNDDIEKAEYTFVYDKNNNLSSIQGKEVYTKSFSSQVTDEQVNEANGNGNYGNDTYKAYIKNKQVIMEYTLSSEDDFVKLFNIHYPTAYELKEVLEENTILTCDGTKGQNDKKETQKNTETLEKKSLKCSGKVYYAYEELNFDFVYDSSKKDYTLNNVQKNLTIPDGYDTNEYYLEEEKSNSGRYEMSLNGRIITFKLDKTSAFWNDYKFKDYSYDNLKKEYSNDGFTCK